METIGTSPAVVVDAKLAEYGVLEQPGGRDLQALVELAALVCAVPTAAINLITGREQRQVAAAGIDPSVCAREDSMCAIVIGEPKPVIVQDASLDERFATNPFVTGQIALVKFYASAPLITPDGVTIGRLCVFDDQARELTAEQAGVLEVLADRMVDVLELRLRTRELEQARDELHRSNELLTLFAGQVSHDLRSPLTAVIANAELLATEPAVVADPDAAALATAIQKAGVRMAGLIDTILRYARTGSSLDVVEVDLERLVSTVREDLAPTLAARRGTVTTGSLPVVRADLQQIYVVLQNLISNAVKFTPVGVAPVVHVAGEVTDSGWRVTVTDNGSGIPADRRDSVFTLYTRGAGNVEGFGIGLATSRRIVEAHGGEIGVEDGPDGGSTFWFTLPQVG